MTKISRSPDRNTFQKENYIKRCRESGKGVSADYLAMFEKIIEEDQKKFMDPASRENNMEYDLLTTDWILEKVKNDSYAQNLYAALCNNEFQRNDMMPILKDQRWSCSWRYSGGIIADMRQQGDYIDWYCSGIRGGYDMGGGPEEDPYPDYVGEGCVTDEIRTDLKKLGWLVIEEE
jgi:hypothetical protein